MSANAVGANANAVGTNANAVGANAIETNAIETNTKCAIYEDDFTKKKKKDLEKDAEAAVQVLFKEKGVNGSSISSVLGALSNGTITEQSLSNIIQKGFDEFKERTGQTMSYGEMRELYG